MVSRAIIGLLCTTFPARAVPATLPKFVIKLVAPKYTRSMAMPILINTISSLNKPVLYYLPYSLGIKFSFDEALVKL